MDTGSYASKAWVVQATDEAVDRERRLEAEGHDIGITNDADITDERWRQLQLQGETPPYLDDIRMDGFSPKPRYVSPSAYAPDFVDRSRMLVSPRLFELLDQPPGSLQGIPTDTVWQGGDPPSWSYLWLSYVPRVSVVDLDRSEVELEIVEKNGKKLRQIRFKDVLHLRDDLDPPCGFFGTAEGGGITLATDAIAAAVVRAGCTGIEFLDPETAFDADGPTMRRGADGPEPYPELSGSFDPDEPRPWDADLPPVGPPLVWDASPVDWFDWKPADTELEAPVPSEVSGDAGNALSCFLHEGIFFDEAVAARVLVAIDDVQAGRSELWISDLPDWILVVRPDAAWVRLEHAYPGDGPYPFPLDGLRAVLKRWVTAIRRAPHPLG